MNEPHEAKVSALRAELEEAIIEAVRAGGELGAPESLLHLALLQIGVPAEMPRVLINGLVARGALRRLRHRIYLGRIG
jgi:hypothetical protein